MVTGRSSVGESAGLISRRSQVQSLPPGPRVCANCGHPDHWHRHDDADNVQASDPDCKFRCLGYDCDFAGPPPDGGRACDCEDFVPT